MSASVLFDAPGPRARARDFILAVLAAFGAGAADRVRALPALGEGSAPTREVETVPHLGSVGHLRAARVQGTLTAAAVSIVFALVLGMVLGVGRLSPIAPIRWICSVVRGVLPRGAGADHDVVRVLPVRACTTCSRPSTSALAGVVTGLTLYNGAVIAEIVRAGVHSFPAVSRRPRGHWD